MTTLASLDHVTRRLDDVSLDIGSGRIVGMLGPNGAGKSTLLSLLQGLRRPTSGIVRLFGGDPSDYRNRRMLGSTPQQTALPPALRVGEVLDHVGAHFENPVPKAQLADEFGFSELLRRQTGSLSALAASADSVIACARRHCRPRRGAVPSRYAICHLLSCRGRRPHPGGAL